MMEVINGHFRYARSRPILQDINLQLGSGELLAILGPNGIGKTTLLRCMLGLLPWSKGKTLIDAHDITSLSSKDLWGHIAYVPQARNAGALSLSGLDMVTIGRSARLGLLSQPGPKDRAVAEEVMAEIGIPHLAHSLCGQMSGGQFQMVLIARALAGEPKILVLDEPETGLDFRNQLIVLNLLESLSKDRGLSVIMNTHYPAHALRISTSALLLHPTDAPKFGPTPDIITAANLQSTFGVEIAISNVSVREHTYPAVIPLQAM
ncbi:MAG: ABC transporter ATP-binding protein [Corynebacterium casei]|uniref:ABC transporter ATP-binding protein n=1 Tax=Corynebacterium casei TaxID=160386 RepID=UPI00264868FB|nr:ABC transporter ATP-binding protein [Corynebacterium casei]MDN5903391.1 ABC transporter ATP-binding protein [Corynebacterium casei]MDN6627574.1 ABC transporter ATP-binding protein [Corynebacterium casei]MDN6674690.1 ABC transporter ATP-binding protein [Corynebacterium casei]MDN6694424.1 ABC transporter ATP-binding protein [Corynebacterium casei]MDN6740396.1 ABC transporter ATP-binding protein [Corynebacterium casei]